MFLKELESRYKERFANTISQTLSESAHLYVQGSIKFKENYLIGADSLKDTVYYGRVYSRKCYRDGFLGATAHKINYLTQFFAWFIGQSAGQKAVKELKTLIKNKKDQELIAPLLAKILESFKKHGDMQALCTKLNIRNKEKFD